MIMLAQTNVKSRPFGTRDYVPPSWLDKYEQLAQPSGGVQTRIDRVYYYNQAETSSFESGKQDFTWAKPQLKLNPALAAIAVWLDISHLPLRFSSENIAFAEYQENPWLNVLQICQQLGDSSGNQTWPVKETAPTMTDIQSFIVKIFSLSGLDDLAKLCSVSRQALYDWRKIGARPDKDNIRRLYALWDTARDWKTFGFPAPAAYLRTPTLKNRSLYDFLSDRDIDVDAIKFIGHRLLITDIR